MDQIKTRVAAFAAMAMCCGMAMAVALGAVALTGAWLAGGVIALIVAGCVGTAVLVTFKARHTPAVEGQ